MKVYEFTLKLQNVFQTLKDTNISSCPIGVTQVFDNLAEQLRILASCYESLRKTKASGVTKNSFVPTVLGNLSVETAICDVEVDPNVIDKGPTLTAFFISVGLFVKQHIVNKTTDATEKTIWQEVVINILDAVAVDQWVKTASCSIPPAGKRW